MTPAQALNLNITKLVVELTVYSGIAELYYSDAMNPNAFVYNQRSRS